MASGPRRMEPLAPMASMVSPAQRGNHLDEMDMGSNQGTASGSQLIPINSSAGQLAPVVPQFLNRDVCFTRYRGSSALTSSTEVDFIFSALSELPDLLQAFIIARREYSKGPSPVRLDKLNLRIHFINTVISMIIGDPEVMDCFEPVHIIGSHCQTFCTLWEKISMHEENENEPLDQIRKIAQFISSGMSQVDMIDSTTLMFREASADPRSGLVVAPYVFLTIFLVAQIGLSAFYLANGDGGFLIIFLLFGVACLGFLKLNWHVQQSAISLLSNRQKRLDEILGATDRYTRGAAPSAFERRAVNPLNPNMSKDRANLAMGSLTTGQQPMIMSTSSPNPITMGMSSGSRTTGITFKKESINLQSMSVPRNQGSMSATGTPSQNLSPRPSQTDRDASPIVPNVAPGQNAFFPNVSEAGSGTGMDLTPPEAAQQNLAGGPGRDPSKLQILQPPMTQSSSMANIAMMNLSGDRRTMDMSGDPGTDYIGSPLDSPRQSVIGGGREFVPHISIGPGIICPLDPLNDTLVIVGVSHQLDITHFNEQACTISEFTADEAKGTSISSLLDEQSFEKLTEMMGHVLEEGEASESVVMTFGGKAETQALRITLIPIFAQEKPIAGLLVGLPEDPRGSTTNVFLVKYFVAQLHREMQALDNAMAKLKEMEALKSNEHFQQLTRVITRIDTYLDRCDWPNICTLAQLMLAWQTVPTDQLLVATTRSHMSQIDLEFSHPAPEAIDVDVVGVNSVVSSVLSQVKQRCKVEVTATQFDEPGRGDRIGSGERGSDDTAALVVIIKDIPLAQESLFAMPTLDAQLAKVGGSVVVNQPGTVTCYFPFQWTIVHSMSVSSDADGMLPRGVSFSQKKPATDLLTFFLYETQPVYKRCVGHAILDLGHAVRVLDDDTPEDIEKSINNLTQGQYQVAILDYSGPNFHHFLEAVGTRPDLTVIVAMNAHSTSGRDTNVEIDGKEYPKLCKPIKARDVKHLAAVAQGKVGEANERNEIASSRAKKLAIHHSSPWKRGKLLGKGSFGDVYEAENLLTRGITAVKIIDFESGDTQVEDTLLNEIDVMCSIAHPNVVHYFYCEQGIAPNSAPGEERSRLFLFMELCRDGTLRDYFSTKKHKYLSLDDGAFAIQQVLLAVAYLHERGIVHRDLKPENILLNEGRLKIADFGTANKIGKATLTGTEGTLRYMAPEIWDDAPYSFPCDIWSLGVVFLEMIGFVPSWLKDANNFTLGGYYAGLQDEKKEVPDLPRGLTGDARDFAERCLQLNPANRPTAAGLLNFPYITLVTGAGKAPAFKRRGSVATTTTGRVLRRSSTQEPPVAAARRNSESTGTLPDGGTSIHRSDSHGSTAAASSRVADTNSNDSFSSDGSDIMGGMMGGPPPGMGGGGGPPPGMGGPPPLAKNLPPGVNGLPPGISAAPPGFAAPGKKSSGSGGGLPPGIGGLPPGITAAPPGFGPPAGSKAPPIAKPAGNGLPPGITSAPPGYGPPAGSKAPPMAKPAGNGLPPGITSAPPGFGPPAGGGAPPMRQQQLPPGITSAPPGFGGVPGMPMPNSGGPPGPSGPAFQDDLDDDDDDDDLLPQQQSNPTTKQPQQPSVPATTVDNFDADSEGDGLEGDELGDIGEASMNDKDIKDMLKAAQRGGGEVAVGVAMPVMVAVTTISMMMTVKVMTRI